MFESLTLEAFYGFVHNLVLKLVKHFGYISDLDFRLNFVPNFGLNFDVVPNFGLNSLNFVLNFGQNLVQIFV